MFGNKVSHSKRKVRRKFYPNIQKLKIWIPSRCCFLSLKLSSKGLRIINKVGIEKFLNQNKG